MKLLKLLTALSVAGLIAGCHTEKNEAALQAEAKISRAEAQATALAQVANGTVKEAELEREHGKLIWSFDITTPDTRNTTEVNIDAMTGAVVSREIETPEQEAKEAKKEQKEKDKD